MEPRPSQRPLDDGREIGLPREPGMLPDARPCLGCGYNLIGLHVGGLCPECGSSIARSLDGNLVRYATPDYVARLHRGAVLAETAVVVLLAGGAVVLALGLLLDLVGSGRGGMGFTAVLVAPFAVAALLSLAGWWLLSAPDPGAIGGELGNVARLAVRGGVTAAALMTGFAGVVVARAERLEGAPVLYATACLVLAWVLKGTVCLCYVAWLAPKLPDAVLIRRLPRLTVLFPLLMTAGWCAFGVGPVVGLSLYYWAVSRLRLDLRAIRAGQAAGPSPATPATM